jgi:hypothetical protein
MSDQTSANIPGAAPLVDKDGRITQAWWQFLLALFNRTGGSGAPIDISTLEALVEAHGKEIDARAVLPPVRPVLALPEPVSVQRPAAPDYAMNSFVAAPARASVQSVFGRSGIVTAQTGDYSVAQVTGAAPTASPTFTGLLTAADGAFTTLSASANDAMLYNNGSAQSIPNNAATTLINWSALSDRVGTHFNASTGTFTAPVAGYYHFSARIAYASHAPSTTNCTYQLGVIVNVAGGNQAIGTFFNESTIGASRGVDVHATVFIGAGQTANLVAFQNTGAAVPLISTGVYNYLSIHRVP